MWVEAPEDSLLLKSSSLTVSVKRQTAKMRNITQPLVKSFDNLSNYLQLKFML